jgi:phage terminase large subunit GpA-like protein
MNKIYQRVDLPAWRVAQIYEGIQDRIDALPTAIPDLSVSDFAEQYRVLPRGTPYPGPWRNARTPYLVDIMNDLSASSQVREVIFMKSAQVGATAGPIENFIGYIMKCVPGPILFVTANEKLLNKWVNKRLSPLLISCGLDDKIAAQHQMKGAQQRTGNKMFSKEFPGGSIDMATANSAAGLRSDSIRYLCLDEVDGYPWDVDKEGDPASIAEARTKAWKKRKKVLYISTPTTVDESHIMPMFQSGDQRKYHVPCPMCGASQELVFGNSDTQFGIKWETKAGKLDPSTIGYQCAHCRELIAESNKFNMVQNGVWEPTAVSGSTHRHSYHISALYSQMEEWETIVENHLKGLKDPQKMRAHVTLDLGLPYQEQGTRPSKDKVLELRGNYDEATIPRGVLFLTMAVDVQAGSKLNDKEPERLEVEILGHCKGYRTKSIAKLVFKGSIKELDSEDSAWRKLDEFKENGGLEFLRDDGMQFGVALCLVDSGHETHVVYDFCAGWPNTYPCKGFRYLQAKQDGKRDVGTPMDRIKYRPRKLPDMDLILWEISTVHFKDRIYQAMTLARSPEDPQRSGFMDHPRQYPDEYFEQLRAEEKAHDEKGQVMYRKVRSRNESLDLKVYNMCAGGIYLNALVEDARQSARQYAIEQKGKFNPTDLLQINYRSIIDMLASQTRYATDPEWKLNI